jgi:outer membrane lipoprotein-sorting protein
VQRAVVSSAFIVAAATTSVAEPSAKDVLAAVDAAYSKVSTATLSFAQTITDASTNSTRKVVGRMWIRRPGQVRWEEHGARRKRSPNKLTDENRRSSGFRTKRLRRCAE